MKYRIVILGESNQRRAEINNIIVEALNKANFEIQPAIIDQENIFDILGEQKVQLDTGELVDADQIKTLDITL